MSINMADFEKLQKVLIATDWYPEVILHGKDYQNLFINRLYRLMLTLTTAEEKKYFLKIIENLDVYTLSSYQDMIANIYYELRLTFQDINKLIVVPLIAPEDNKSYQIKSGSFVAYLFKSFNFSYIDEKNKFTSIPIEIKSSLKKIDIDNMKENNKILLVDDFIGSGSQAKGIIEKYRKEGITPDNTVISSLVCLPQGILQIEKLEYQFFYSRIGNTLSSIFSDTRDLQIARDTNKYLSKYVNAGENYHYGYKESEALVILVRTPNNTLPFFWKHKKRKKTAIFER